MARPIQRMPEFAVVGFGMLGTTCEACVLVPQALLNARRRSTQGMSVGRILMWHLGAILSAGYYATPSLLSAVGDADGTKGDLWAMLSSSFFGLVCCFVEAQVLAYRHGAAPGWGPCFTLTLGMIMLTAVFLACLAALTWTLSGLPEASSYILAMACAVVLLGFVPQLWEFVTSRSTEGNSFGVTAVDIVGCSSNIIVMFAPSDVGFGEAVKEALPFVTIIAMHTLLISVAAWVNLVGSRRSAPSVAGKPVDETPSEESAAERASAGVHGGGMACNDSPVGVQHA